MGEIGVWDVVQAYGGALGLPGACPYCSSAHQAVMHSGACPRVRAIEYHPNGTVKRIEFREGDR